MTMFNLSNWDLSKVPTMTSVFSNVSNVSNFSMPRSDTSIIISRILNKYNLTYFEEYLTRNHCVRFILKDIDTDLEVLEVNSDHPLSEEEHLSLIRSYIRDKKIDELLG